MHHCGLLRSALWLCFGNHFKTMQCKAIEEERTEIISKLVLFKKRAVKQVSQNRESLQLSHACFLVAIDYLVFLFLHAAMSNAVVRTVLLWRMAFPCSAWAHLRICTFRQFIKSFFGSLSQNNWMAGYMIQVMRNVPSVALRGEEREQGPSLPIHDWHHFYGICRNYW